MQGMHMPGPFLNHKPHQHPSINQLRDTKSLTNDLNTNQCDIYILNREDFIRLWIDFLKRRNQTIDEIKSRLSLITGLSISQTAAWFGANLGAATLDTPSFVKLANDFKKSGNIYGKYELVTKNGKDYIHFKGNHKLRNIIKGTRYLANNTRVLTAGIGREAIKNGAKQGFLISIFFSITLNSINWIFDNEYRWTNWLATTTTDIVKIVISSLAAFLLTVVIAKACLVVVAVGAGILIGVAIGFTMNWIDQKLGVTEALIDHLNKVEVYVKNKLNKSKQTIYYIVSKAIVKTVQIAIKEHIILLINKPFNQRVL